MSTRIWGGGGGGELSNNTYFLLFFREMLALGIVLEQTFRRHACLCDTTDTINLYHLFDDQGPENEIVFLNPSLFPVALLAILIGFGGCAYVRTRQPLHYQIYSLTFFLFGCMNLSGLLFHCFTGNENLFHSQRPLLKLDGGDWL